MSLVKSGLFMKPKMANHKLLSKDFKDTFYPQTLEAQQELYVVDNIECQMTK